MLQALDQDVSIKNISQPEGVVKAVLEENTIEKYLQDYASTNPKYAQAFISLLCDGPLRGVKYAFCA